MLRERYAKWLRYVVVVFACLAVALTTPVSIAAPTGPHDWLNNQYILSSDLTYNSEYIINRACYDATVHVAGYDEPQEGCVFSGQNYELFRGYSFMAIRFGSENQFYEITTRGDEPLGRTWAYLVPGTNTLAHFQSERDDDPYALMAIYDNFTGKLARDNSSGHVTYSLTHATPSFVLHDSVGGALKANPYTVSYSNNGRYMLVDIVGGGIVRVDTILKKQRAITGLERHLSLDWAGWSTSMAASDDGKYVAVGGEYRNEPSEIRVYQLSGNCGDEYIDTLSVADVCPKTSIQYIEMVAVGAYEDTRPTDLLYFDSMNNLAVYVEGAVNDPFPCESDDCLYRHFRVKIGGTNIPSSRLDYLAIGDSYTSGEGDIEGNGFYYRPGTGGNGGCHLSSRSYPFLLRSYWGVASSKMQSVACSGARVNEDYLSDISSYLGQSLQLKGLSANTRNSRQTSAINQFTPGLVPQLEFIKTYKPKIVTVMGGGNDVKFSTIIESCASGPLTCSHASSGTMAYALGNSIDNFYNIEVKLIQQIKQASPSTKIYVVGYPQFIKNGICALNSGLLNSAEITMINNSVTRLNGVLARVAQNTGVAYVSTENSLSGGRLCEGSQYMTGAVDSLKATGNPAAQSSFHPNHKGHAKMAETIKNQTGTKPPRLQGSDTFTNSFDSVILDKIAIVGYMALAANSTVQQGSTVKISLPPLSLLPGSLIQLFLHSDPVHLGTLIVKSDGALSGEVALPTNTPLGSHTLVLEGYSYSGEPLTYYQPVTALSNTPSDRDGDGILDEYDKCDFMPYWFDEITGKDLCAPDITAPATIQKTAEPLMLPFETLAPQDTSENSIVNLLNNTAIPHSTTGDTTNNNWSWFWFTIVLTALLACISAVVYSNRKKYHE